MNRCSLNVLEQWASQTTHIPPSLVARIFSPWLSGKTSERKTYRPLTAVSGPPAQRRTYVTLSDPHTYASTKHDSICRCVRSRVSATSGNVNQRGLHTISHHGQASQAIEEEHSSRSSSKPGDNIEPTTRLDNLTSTEEDDYVTPSHRLNRQIGDHIMDSQETWDSVRYRLQGKVSRKIRRATKATIDGLAKADDVTSARISTTLQSLGNEKVVVQVDALDPLHIEDRLDAAYHSAKQGNTIDTEDILELLRRSLLAGQDIEDIRVLKLASLLLRRSKGAEGQYHDSSTIVAALSDMGVRLNLTMFNVLMLNAAEMNDPATAWRIYDLIFEHGVRPDAYTNVILLSMCRYTNDKASYHALYRGIKPEQRQLSLHLATEIMLCRYHFNARENLEHILSFYELHFDLEPLLALGIVTHREERMLATRERNENNIKMQPSSVALNIVLRIYARRKQTQQSIRRVYDAFQSMLINRHAIITSLVSTTHAYNEFFKAICRTPGTVMTWRTVMGDMKRPSPDLRIIQAAPDLQTWNIILNSCMTCGLYDEAKKVWNTMRMEGHKPDTFSWNTRLDGFSKRQRIAAAADTLKRMLAAGIEPDKITARALNRIKHKEFFRREIVRGQWDSLDTWTATMLDDPSDGVVQAKTSTLDCQAEAHDAIKLSSSTKTVLLGPKARVKVVDPNVEAAQLIQLARKAVEQYRVEKHRGRLALTSTSKAFKRWHSAQQVNRFRKYYFHGWRYRLRGPRAAAPSKYLKPSSRQMTSEQRRRLLSKPRRSRSSSMRASSGAGNSHTRKR